MPKLKKKLGRPRLVRGNQLKQSHFMCVEYYMQGHSKQDCMRLSGYSESTYMDRTDLVFNRDDVKQAIEQRRWDIKYKTNNMAQRVQEELARIAFFNIGNFIRIDDDGQFVFDYSEATMDDLAAIGEITVEEYTEGRGEDAREVKRIKVKPYDKKAALDSLARIHGMFNDKLDVTTSEGGSLEERIQAGRARVNKAPAMKVLEAEEVFD